MLLRGLPINKKPAQIDLTYQHPALEDSASDSDSASTSIVQHLRKRRATIDCNPSKQFSYPENTDQWALGGLACKAA